MGFWDFLRGRGGTIAHLSPNVTFIGGAEWPAEFVPGIDVGGMGPAQMWETQPHLRTVVGFIARNIAQLGLHAFVSGAGGSRERDKTSPVATLLKQGHGELTTYDLVFALVGDLMLFERAYWLVTASADTTSGWALTRLPPNWVSPIRNNPLSLDGWRVAAASRTVDVPVGSMLAFGGYHPSSPVACSPTVNALKDILSEHAEATLYRKQVWKRGGRVSAVITRPADAPAWSDGAREKFREDWYAKYTGRGSRAGGTPILGDGMDIKKLDLSAQDQQWAEGIKLSLTQVASAFHINPSMVGILDNANYSNMREFRRMLYTDSLGPTIARIEDRLNTFLLPMLGADTGTYLEFNVSEKLQGSFEEQAAVMQTMVGGPVMTRNEARTRLNLPAIEGGDELIVPLNVMLGGQASPTDSAPPPDPTTVPKAPDLGTWETRNLGNQEKRFPGSQETGNPGTQEPSNLGSKAARSASAVTAKPRARTHTLVEETLGKTFTRQRAAVMTALGKKAGGLAADDLLDVERFDEELASDLFDLAFALVGEIGPAVLKTYGQPPTGFDVDQTAAWLQAVTSNEASRINATTLAQIDEALARVDEDPELTVEGEVGGVFDLADAVRVASGAAIAVATWAGFGVREAGQQSGASQKQWVTGENPRPEHAAMNGEIANLGEKFSNGLEYPGDPDGDLDNICGCNCTLDLIYQGE